MLGRLLLHHPLGIIVSCLCLVTMGAVAMGHIAINLHPKTQLPALTITTELYDSDPEEVETLITKRLEEALSDMPALKKMQSYSKAGDSEITLQFHQGRDVSEAALEVRSRIRRILPTLPKDARFPVITRYDPSSAPLLVLAVTSRTSSLQETARWVNSSLRPQLNRINGVAAVRVAGAPNEEIIVDCDIGRLDATNITVHEIASAIETSHTSLPAGHIESRRRRIAVRTTGYLANPQEIGRQPVLVGADGAPLTVADFGKISSVIQEPEEIVRLNGEPLIAVSLFRLPDADIRRVGNAIRKRLSEIQAKDEGVPQIEIIFNQAEELDKVINRLYGLIPVTALITGVTLFAFLGTLSATFVILASIPLSLGIAILLMRLMGLSLDLLSLTGLTLGLGILVDNAIVVIEAISKRWNEGLSTADGVVAGTREVAIPLALSTMITITVFFPVVFVSQDVRAYFTGFSWTVALSLTASLAAALILVPVLFRYFGYHSRNKSGLIKLWVIARGYKFVFVTANRLFFLIVTLVCVFLGAAAYCTKDLSFKQSQSSDSRQLKVYMLMPPATHKSFTDQKAKEVESLLLSMDWIKRLYTEIRGSQATLRISMREGGIPSDPVETVRSKLKRVRNPDGSPTQFHIVPVDEQGGDPTISVRLQSRDPDQLSKLSDVVRADLAKVKGVKDVLVHQGNPVPSIEFTVSQEKVGFYNIEADTFAQQLRGNLTGPVAARIRGADRTTVIRVRSSRTLNEGLAVMQSATVPNHQGKMIPFMELVQPSVRLIPTVLIRENRQPVVPFTLVLGNNDPLTVSSGVQKALDKISFPPGAGWSFGPEVSDILRTKREMLTAGTIGLILIYLILVMATELLIQPLFIMVAIPFALGGAVFALRYCDMPVSLPVYMGMIILSGLVININIVMAYTINEIRQRGKPPLDAALHGAQRRLRPILMSLFTAVGGCLPMLLDRGAGSSMWAPFALTLAAGMPAATLFSLILMPGLFAGSYGFKKSKGLVKAK